MHNTTLCWLFAFHNNNNIITLLTLWAYFDMRKKVNSTKRNVSDLHYTIMAHPQKCYMYMAQKHSGLTQK